MTKIKDNKAVFPPEHPEDRAIRERCERAAVKHGAELARQYDGQLRLLLTTYADDDAAELLAELRDKFWTDLSMDEGDVT